MDSARLGRIDEHFRTRYIEPGKIAGCQVAVYRHGSLAHFSSHGYADRENQVPVAEDTIWRIYSMTKPVTSVALMTLYERGLFQLTDPVSRFIPEWREMKVAVDGQLVSADREPTVRDVMMHTSGIGYGPANADLNVGRLSEGRPVSPRMGDRDLEAMAVRLGGEPLRFHPGTHWLYSFGTDVCARLVEILSGKRFDDYLRAAIFEPLGMNDTGFYVPEEEVSRFARCYARNSRKELVLVDDDRGGRDYLTPPTFLSGGGGLVSTTTDYLKFCQMLLAGGDLDGRRVLGRKTVELMTVNHLPGGGSMRDFALAGGYGEVGFDGMGFGLTMAVSLGPAQTGVIGSAGEFMWGGAASTIFWVDPTEDLTVVFMTQLLPSGTFNFRGQLKTIVYPAIVD
jgi:CubicO group peptidase (beta-lactamase class C family)